MTFPRPGKARAGPGNTPGDGWGDRTLGPSITDVKAGGCGRRDYT